jgi:hypothetical protein
MLVGYSPTRSEFFAEIKADSWLDLSLTGDSPIQQERWADHIAYVIDVCTCETNTYEFLSTA